MSRSSRTAARASAGSTDGPPPANTCPVLAATDQSTGLADPAGRAGPGCRVVATFTLATLPDSWTHTQTQR
jgi:hypothetical protein